MRGADESATHRARSLRRSQTEAEERYWALVRGRRLNGWKFVRQKPVGPYFADFACREARLNVELDGSRHADSLHDTLRDAALKALGWNVLRFWNADVFCEPDSVLETVLAALEARLGDGFPSMDVLWKPA
jgi:very-short-patch-repair endonuclease